jgi:5-methylcytosine-specific restriction enzyme A
MPKKAPTPCRHHCCPKLVDLPGYCDEHAHESIGWQSDRDRGTRQQRGYGAKWQKLRKRILSRDNGLCQQCRRRGRITAATHVDHIVNKARGGTDDESNLESICRTCHALKTGRESHGGSGAA